MGLEHRRACTHNFATLASTVARRTNGLHSPLSNWEVEGGGQGALECGLSCPIQIKHEETVALAVQEAAELLASKTVQEKVVLKELAERIEARTIDISQK